MLGAVAEVVHQVVQEEVAGEQRTVQCQSHLLNLLLLSLVAGDLLWQQVQVLELL
jgi:hypothetical protein